MKEIIGKYNEFLIKYELTKGTRSIYIRQAKKLLLYIGENKLTKELVIDYKEELKNRNLATTTINLYLIAINKFVRYLGYEDCCVKLHRVQKVEV